MSASDTLPPNMRYFQEQHGHADVPLPELRRYADVDAAEEARMAETPMEEDDGEEEVAAGRQILDDDDPRREGDVVYLNIHRHDESVRESHVVLFATIRNVCDRLRRTHVSEDGYIMYIDVDVPQDSDRDVQDFKDTLSALISYCYSYTHLSILVRFVLVGPSGERRFQYHVSDVLSEDARGRLFFRFVNDETVFWALYDDEVIALVGALCLRSFQLVVVAHNSSQRSVSVHGRRFPFELRRGWEAWSQLLKVAQIHPAESIGYPQAHCLINALREATKEGSGEPFFTTSQLVAMTYKMNGCHITTKTLDAIAREGRCTICVNIDPESSERRRTVKTKAYGPVVKVDLWRHGMARHYIPHKVIPASEWKDLAKKFKININDSTMQLTLIHLVNILMHNDAFCFPTVYFPYHEYCFASHGVRKFARLTKELVASETQYERIEPAKKKKAHKYDLYFADFECFVTGPHHQPFCICYEGVNDAKTKHFYGLNCRDEFLAMLDGKGRDCIVYFHNLGYDGRFLIAGRVEDLIMKGNAIYQMVLVRPIPGTSKDYKVVLRDSLALIPSRLAAFPAMFHLETTGPKEIFPYHYYNERTMHIGRVAECGATERPQWNKSEIDHFKANLRVTDSLLADEETFDAKKYCLFYCERDVQILKQGFLKFQRDCKDDFRLDCTDFLTISSLAYHYVRTTAFEKQNVFSYNGYIREWIRRAILGGRCMTRQNRKWVCDVASTEEHVFKKPLVDFDACSLYPSAMRRLLIPKGKPHIIPRECLTYEWLSAHTLLEQQSKATPERFISCYVVRIRITKNNVRRDFPLIYKRGDGTLTYTNDDDVKLVVSNVYLEDLVRYHRIEFTIKEGIMWTGGKSGELSRRIQDIYDKRNALKAERNPKETIYKLMMNSSYGKTIQKMINDDIHVYSRAETEQCQMENAERIRAIETIDDDHYFVNMYPSVDDLFIPIIVGCLILDMSKRIMNEVFDCCDQLGIPVFYQDTDSIHIPMEDVPRLSRRFRDVHGRDLIGKQMGQFHPDFPPINGKESWAVKSIFCGKKCYYDRLTNADGDVGEHFRLKGIPQDVIEHEAGRFGGKIDKLYEHLHAGKEIKFDLLCTRDRFKYTKAFMIVNNSEFNRVIKF